MKSNLLSQPFYHVILLDCELGIRNVSRGLPDMFVSMRV